jgi:hypothetical protein
VKASSDRPREFLIAPIPDDRTVALETPGQQRERFPRERFAALIDSHVTPSQYISEVRFGRIEVIV